jgi:hypothetical protein
MRRALRTDRDMAAWQIGFANDVRVHELPVQQSQDHSGRAGIDTTLGALNINGKISHAPFLGSRPALIVSISYCPENPAVL